MTAPAFELSQYLARIGYSGSRASTLDVLREVHWRHITCIAFENLDVLMERPIRTDVGSLVSKLVEGGRGGYCYEQNGLLLHALQALGFHVRPLLARTLWQRNPSRPVPRTHMLLRVDLDEGAFIVDAGFGSYVPTAPLALMLHVEQPTPLEAFRLVPQDGHLELQVQLPRLGWAPVYSLLPEPVLLVDCEPMNWFHSTSPISPFTQNLAVARPDGLRRHTLRNGLYSTRDPDGRTERREMRSGTEIMAVLAEVFLLDISRDPDPAALLSRLELIAATPTV
jgi:N-hydroxyarylamine O-acetyltransferase